MTLGEIAIVLAGDRQRSEDDQALAYYQAYMAGVFSQSYPKGKYPKYETNAPWRKVRKGNSADPEYTKRFERMMMMFTEAKGGKVH